MQNSGVRPWLVALAASAWFLFLILSPVSPVPVAAAAYALGSLVCHQIPARSFHYGAIQLPVCARCIGIYGGAAVASVFFAADMPGPGTSTSLPRRRALAARRRALVAGCLPMAATVALEWIGVWAPGNMTRAITGVALGVAAAFVVVGAAATIHYDECARRRPNEPSPPPASI